MAADLERSVAACSTSSLGTATHEGWKTIRSIPYWEKALLICLSCEANAASPFCLRDGNRSGYWQYGAARPRTTSTWTFSTLLFDIPASAGRCLNTRQLGRTTLGTPRQALACCSPTYGTAPAWPYRAQPAPRPRTCEAAKHSSIEHTWLTRRCTSSVELTFHVSNRSSLSETRPLWLTRCQNSIFEDLALKISLPNPI